MYLIKSNTTITHTHSNMGAYYLKNADKGLYFKDMNTQDETIEFTENINEAKKYTQGDWYANTELEFLQFHFPNEEETLANMKAVYV